MEPNLRLGTPGFFWWFFDPNFFSHSPPDTKIVHSFSLEMLTMNLRKEIFFVFSLSLGLVILFLAKYFSFGCSPLRLTFFLFSFFFFLLSSFFFLLSSFFLLPPSSFSSFLFLLSLLSLFPFPFSLFSFLFSLFSFLFSLLSSFLHRNLVMSI